MPYPAQERVQQLLKASFDFSGITTRTFNILQDLVQQHGGSNARMAFGTI
jgi:hypothetical protein